MGLVRKKFKFVRLVLFFPSSSSFFFPRKKNKEITIKLKPEKSKVELINQSINPILIIPKSEMLRVVNMNVNMHSKSSSKSLDEHRRRNSCFNYLTERNGVQTEERSISREKDNNSNKTVDKNQEVQNTERCASTGSASTGSASATVVTPTGYDILGGRGNGGKFLFVTFVTF